MCFSVHREAAARGVVQSARSRSFHEDVLLRGDNRNIIHLFIICLFVVEIVDLELAK